MLTITVAVGLLPLVSITVDATEIYELPYITAITHVDYGMTLVYANSAPSRVLSTSTSTSTSYVQGFAAVGGVYQVQIAYSEALNDWVTVAEYDPEITSRSYYVYGTSMSASSGSPIFWHETGSDFSDYSIVTNYNLNSYEQALFAGYSNDISQLPQGLTESTIQQLINDQLNTQTESGATASQIITDTTASYTSYQNGDIDSAQMQQIITTNLDTLSDLSDNTGNTLSDLMQINNAITYNQSIQDGLVNNVSSDLQAWINERLTLANSLVDDYRTGNMDQKSVMFRLQRISLQLGGQLINYTSTADMSAINASVDTIQNFIEMVSSFKDVSVESSDKSQTSDQAELDYLDELTAETTATVEQIAPSKNFTSTQTGEAKQVLELIWENEFVKRLLPMCAGFMVVCVVLGVKYKV